MPSPFPGMDPYLENPRWFHGLHNNYQDPVEPPLQPEKADWFKVIVRAAPAT